MQLSKERNEQDGRKAESGLTPLPDFSDLETGPIHEQSMKEKAEKEAREEANRRYQIIIAAWRDNHPDAPLDGTKVFRREDKDNFELHNKDRFHQSLIGLEVEFARSNGAWETGVCVDVQTHTDFSYWLTIGTFDGRTYAAQWSRCRIKGGWQDANSRESVQSDTERD